MKSQTPFIPCDEWDLTIPNLPPRSHLYSLQPIGLGTPYTESLSSYLQRLAQHHHLRPWQLYTHELLPLLENEEYLLSIDTNKTAIRQTFLSVKTTPSNLSVVNGIKSMTRVIVESIEQLTRRDDLRCLTLVSWFNILRSYYCPLKQFCAWCPHCYQVWQEQEEVIYLPLLWLFNEVEFCPIHHIGLESFCPYCRQRMLNFCQPGYCSHCLQWLGRKHPPLNLADYFPSPEKLNIYQQKLFCLQDLIQITPFLSQPPRMKDVCVYLHEYCSHLDEQELKVFDNSFWLRLELIRDPQKCTNFYSSGTCLDFFYDLFRYLHISPRQLFCN